LCHTALIFLAGRQPAREKSPCLVKKLRHDWRAASFGISPYKMTFGEFGIPESGSRPEHTYDASLDGENSANGIWGILHPEAGA